MVPQRECLVCFIPGVAGLSSYIMTFVLILPSHMTKTASQSYEERQGQRNAFTIFQYFLFVSVSELEGSPLPLLGYVYRKLGR